MIDVLICKDGTFLLCEMNPLKVEEAEFLPYNQIKFNLIKAQAPWKIEIPTKVKGILVYGYLYYENEKIGFHSTASYWNIKKAAWELVFQPNYGHIHQIDLSLKNALSTIKLEAL